MTRKTKIIIPLLLVSLLLLASVGSFLLKDSKAQASYQPLAVGVNFQAGWGSHSDADNVAIIDKLAAAGVKYVRIDMGWASVEYDGDIFGDSTDPTATYNPAAPVNQWYVKKIDTAVNYANSKGIKVLGIWWTTPPWARVGGGTYPDAAYVRPTNNAEYAESIEWAAKYWQGRIDSWEIWNEADPYQSFWAAPPNGATYGGTAEYSALLKAAYPAVKRGNPNAKVVTSGPSSLDDAWISSLYANGIKGYFDVLAVHAYEAPANYGPLSSDGSKRWNFLHLPAVHQVMIDNGDTDKPIWITEMGWSSHANTSPTTTVNENFGVTDQQQGDFLVQAIEYAKNNWPYVELLVDYSDRNLASVSGSAEYARHQMNFGLLNTDNSVKPAYTILAQYLNSKPSDINKDGNVDVFDLSILLSKWDTTDASSDINKDGTVNILDLSVLLSKWGL